jgi:predicted phosphodiesterase
MWHTNRPAIPSVIISGPDGQQRIVRNSTDGIIDGGGTLHKVRIDGLTMGTEYKYQTVSKQLMKYQPYKIFYGDTLVSKDNVFTTSEKRNETLNFVVLNDIHERSDLMGSFLRQANNRDLYFFNGDMIHYLQNPSQIFNGFLDTAVYYFAKEKPFYLVRGNHETRGMLARELKDYFDFPDNRFYYALNRGPVHFIILDCGEDKPDDNRYYYNLAAYDDYRLEQLEWLKEHVVTEDFIKAKYRIVIIHMPIYVNNRSGYGMQFLASHFGPVLQEAGIDLMISGHTHRTVFHEKDESGFGYPVLVSSNNTFTDIYADQESIKATIIDKEGNTVLEKIIK